jgi:colanic acid biosynthesis glycosyl transferase WcaI
MVQRAVAKGVAPERAGLLPNWVDLSAIQPQGPDQRASNPYRKELGIADGAVVLLYSGSMNKKQGLGLLVEAIQQLTDLPNLVWLLAGEGPSKGELAAATAGIANVTLLPLQPAERLNDWLNLADVHLLPQKAGAADLVLPSKLLGILASGRPVVASSHAASELGHLAEQAGLRVDPEDGAGFAAAVRQLVQAPALRAALGAHALGGKLRLRISSRRPSSPSACAPVAKIFSTPRRLSMSAISGQLFGRSDSPTPLFTKRRS